MGGKVSFQEEEGGHCWGYTPAHLFLEVRFTKLEDAWQLETSHRLEVDVGKLQGLVRIGADLPNTGKGFRIPLPALSMTRAQRAHDHFRMQG